MKSLVSTLMASGLLFPISCSQELSRIEVDAFAKAMGQR